MTRGANAAAHDDRNERSLTAAYMVSRGLAKSGSREPYND
jgi:hypothetical protein